MKKTLSLLLTAVMLLSAAACCAWAEEPGLTDQVEDSLHASIQHETDSPAWVSVLPAAQDENITQLFIVAGLGMDKTTASVSMHERDESGNWKQVLSTPGFVGKNGLCMDEDHAEGCGQTPVGTYIFNEAFGIAADPGCAIPYTQVTDDIWWSGDMREGMRYNEMVNIQELPDLDRDNSEHIIDYEYQYQYCLNISFNADGTPGRGSAIFLHCFGPLKPYTGGCVALPENIMKLVMQRVQPDCVVVIDTMERLSAETWDSWGFKPSAEEKDWIDIGASGLYTQEELRDAAVKIVGTLASWEVCELHSLRYAGDECCTEENLKWMNELNEEGEYTQIAAFLMDFHTAADAEGAWEPDTEYTDYQWWLARNADGAWDLLTWGY
ncbi:MAG: hypothetical protein K6C08_03825 [Oscillospiraceae bacterium]|nr:hypothetical protein [Oscillospiraceae bacterium]